MKLEYCPKKVIISDFYIKLSQGKLCRLFKNLILNLHEEDIRYMTNLENLTKTEPKSENAKHEKAVESVKECVVENKKTGSPNSVNVT